MKHPIVVVNVSECFDKDRGAFEKVTLWDGVELSYRTDCARSSTVRAETNATRAQIAAAAEAYKATVEPVYCVRLGENNLVGHTYVVGGSRKVSKGTIVVVVDQIAAGYDSRYNRPTPARVLVEFDGQREWISTNCLKTWVAGAAPFWAGNVGVSDEVEQLTAQATLDTPTAAYSAIVGGITVVSDGIGLLDVKVAAAKAWARHYDLSYSTVVAGIETGDLAYKDAAIFMSQVYFYFNK